MGYSGVWHLFHLATANSGTRLRFLFSQGGEGLQPCDEYGLSSNLQLSGQLFSWCKLYCSVESKKHCQFKQAEDLACYACFFQVPLNYSQSFLLPHTPPSCPWVPPFSQCSLTTDLILCSPFCLGPLFENVIQILVSVIFPRSFCFCLYCLQDTPSRCKSGKTALEKCGQLEKETSHINLAQNLVQLNIYLGFLVVLNLLLILSQC